MGIQRRKLVDEFWIDFTDGINVEKTWVFKGLEDLAVNIPEVWGILFVVVFLRRGHVVVGIVGCGSGNIELGGGEKDVVFCVHYVRVSVLVVAGGSGADE